MAELILPNKPLATRKHVIGGVEWEFLEDSNIARQLDVADPQTVANWVFAIDRFHHATCRDIADTHARLEQLEARVAELEKVVAKVREMGLEV